MITVTFHLRHEYLGELLQLSSMILPAPHTMRSSPDLVATSLVPGVKFTGVVTVRFVKGALAVELRSVELP